MIALLTTKQYKLNKGESLGYATAGIQLAPATEGGPTTCASAGGCAAGCIVKTGMNGMATHRTARVKRTKFFRSNPAKDFAQVQAELDGFVRKQTRDGFKVAVRPNTLSDLLLMAQTIARANPGVQVYDYTKHPRPASRPLSNYHLTYSYSEKSTAADVQHCVDHRVNIAVIFSTKRGAAWPATVTLHGVTLPVIDGDETDLRFLDPSDRCYVVGLRWKIGKDSQTNLAAAIKAGLAIAAEFASCLSPC